MIVIDANPASFHTGTYGWNSCGAVSLVLQRKAGPEEYTSHFSSFPSENCSSVYFRAETWSFWYYSLHFWEERIFQHQAWSHLNSKSVTSWREGHSLQALVSCGKKGDFPVYLWKQLSAAQSPGFLEDKWRRQQRSLLLQTATEHRTHCCIQRTGDRKDQNFAGVEVEGH